MTNNSLPVNCVSTNQILTHRAVHITFFHLGGGGGGGGAGKVISGSREHDRPAVLHFRGVWGYAPTGNFGNFRCSEAHSGAF